MKECDVFEAIINDSKFGFTCDNVNDQLGFINLPHIPKSENYAELDNREIRILQADRYNDYQEAMYSSFYGIFQDSSCGTLSSNQKPGQVNFAGSFEDDSCLVQNEKIEDENGDVFDIKR